MDRLIHPRFSLLSDFIDGELSRRRMNAISRHLLRCPKCQATVDSLRLIQSATHQLGHAPLKEQHRARVRSLGHQESPVTGSITPPPVASDLDRPAASAIRRHVAAAAGCGLLLVAGLMVLRTDARSDTSELIFNNMHPTPGDVVSVKYTPDGRFSFGEEVILRGEVYQRNRPMWDQTGRFVTHTLRRARRGEYHGEFAWGDSNVVYTEFAVESSEAEFVDRHADWNLREHVDGRPTFAALRQQYLRASRRHDPSRSMHVALEATETYREEPEAWDILEYNLRIIYGGNRIPESWRRRLDDGFDSLVTRVDDPEWTTSRRVSALYWWALSRNDQHLPELRARMLQYGDLTHQAIMARTLAIDSDQVDPQLGLERYEALWRTAGQAHPFIAETAFRKSVEVGNALLTVTWGQRWLGLRESTRGYVASRLLEMPTVRDSGIAILKRGLQVLVENGDSSRFLAETQIQQAARISTERRTFARMLGIAMIEDDQVDEGLSYIELSLDAGWDVAAFRAAAHGYLARGDTSKATELLARVAVEDELHDRDSDAFEMGARLSGSAWAQRLDDASQAVDLATGLELQAESPLSPIEVLDMDGTTRPLASVLLGKANVIAFEWLNTSSASVRLSALSLNAGRWLKSGATTYVLTDEYPDAVFRSKAASYPNLVWLHDLNGDARTYFDTWRVPDYFVVNRDGSAQFRSTRLEDIPRQLAYLKAHPEYAANPVAPEE